MNIQAEQNYTCAASVPELEPFVAVVAMSNIPVQPQPPVRVVSMYSLCSKRFLLRHLKVLDKSYRELSKVPDDMESA